MADSIRINFEHVTHHSGQFSDHLHAAHVLSRNSGAPALVAAHIAKLTHHLAHIAGDLGFALVPLSPAPIAQIQTEAEWPVQPKES